MEVRYHMMRPKEIVERRKECPVLYIPIGTIEWHGAHNPVGADSLQAEGLAIMCAQKGGGLVFPPLYYGENRSEQIVEVDSVDKELVAAKMEIDMELLSGKHMPYDAMQQSKNYVDLLIHILAQAETLGFKLAVLVAGHYPLIDYARCAVLMHSKRRRNRIGSMLSWALVDYLLVDDLYKFAGDHGAGWETSHLLYLYPETVDMSLLPPEGENPIGIKGGMDARDATAAFGKETMEKAAEIALKEVEHRLLHPESYTTHGKWLQEKMWIKKD